jgi:[ribosomal protein S5]-alanine N-acetyltransferase
MLQLLSDPFPVLTTERLVLRRITPADIPAIFRMRSNEELMRHIGRPVAKKMKV